MECWPQRWRKTALRPHQKTKRPKRDKRTDPLRDLRAAVNYLGLLLVPVPDLQDLATAWN